MIKWIKNVVLTERGKQVGGWWFMYLPFFMSFEIGFGWTKLSEYTVVLSLGPFSVSWQSWPT